MKLNKKKKIYFLIRTRYRKTVFFSLNSNHTRTHPLTSFSLWYHLQLAHKKTEFSSLPSIFQHVIKLKLNNKNKTNGRTTVQQNSQGHFRNYGLPRNFLRLSCVRTNLDRRIHLSDLETLDPSDKQRFYKSQFKPSLSSPIFFFFFFPLHFYFLCVIFPEPAFVFFSLRCAFWVRVKRRGLCRLDGESGVLGRNDVVREERVRELGGGAGIERQGEEGGSLPAETTRRCGGSGRRRKGKNPKTHVLSLRYSKPVVGALRQAQIEKRGCGLAGRGCFRFALLFTLLILLHLLLFN